VPAQYSPVVCICMYVYMNACICVECMFVCVYVCMYVFMYVVIDAGSGGRGSQANIHLLCVYACTYI
jgi:hypothetical protein